MVLRNFERKQITKRRSDELRNEISRLMYLKWKMVTIMDKRGGEEVENAVGILNNMQGKAVKGAKRKIVTGDVRKKELIR